MGLGPFSPHRPSVTVPPNPISRASSPLPFPTLRSLPLGAHLSVPSLPSNPPAQRPRVAGDIDSGHCRAPSHHLELVVIVGQLLPHLRTLVGHPVSSLTEESRRPVASVVCCQGRCATTMLTPSTRRQGLAQRLCFLCPCWHRGRASSFKLKHFIIYVFFCNSRTHVITLYSGHVCVVLCVNALILITHIDPGYD
jgi:hypothetical protein